MLMELIIFLKYGGRISLIKHICVTLSLYKDTLIG